MEIEIIYDCSKIDWNLIPEILKSVGLAYEKPEIHKKAFEASHTVIFIYQDSRLIGFGRAISDGAYQAAVYDIAVVPEFQKMGIGKMIMEKIMERLSGCNVILYAALGKEEFYQKLGWRKMKTGMAHFKNPERMKERGFTD